MPRREVGRRRHGSNGWVGAPDRGAGKSSRGTQGLLSSKSHLDVQVPLSSSRSFLCPNLAEAEKVDFGLEMGAGMEMGCTFLRCGEGAGMRSCRGGKVSAPGFKLGVAS